ncbi:MAG: hypothetical protein B7X41_05745, partial [Microbacterium sp. 14-71-5]
SLTWDARLLFIGLWSYVDDNGVGRDVEPIIAADLFALEPDPVEALRKVRGGLTELSLRNLVIRYTVNGKPFLAITTWSRHQKINRPSPARFPGPDQGIVRDAGGFTEDSLRTHAPEQGNRGSEDQGTEDQPSSSEAAEAPVRPEITRLLDLLDAEIERNGARKPNRTQKNTDAARLLLDRDGKTVEQVEAAIRWCQSDEFWRSNILSMSKLREKYEQLSLAAKRQGTRSTTAYEQGAEVHDILLARQQKAVNA